MNEDLISHVMEDEEVRASKATSYQIAHVIACVLEYQSNQPERSKREDLCALCEKNHPIYCDDCFMQRVGCGALNTMET